MIGGMVGCYILNHNIFKCGWTAGTLILVVGVYDNGRPGGIKPDVACIDIMNHSTPVTVPFQVESVNNLSRIAAILHKYIIYATRHLAAHGYGIVPSEQAISHYNIF